MSEKQLSPIREFEKQLATKSNQLSSLLPDHITKEKFMRLTSMAIQRNPDMLMVNRETLFTEIFDCAQDGLMPDGREAALVKFGNDAVYMPMIAGILKKIRQSGELISITPGIVYSGEQFEYWTDENGPHFKHVPDFLKEGSSTVLAVYALAITKDGGKYIEVMKKADIEKVRNVSKAKSNGPWVQWWDEMAKKTVIRRLAKRLPMSTDVEKVVFRDDRLYDLKDERDVTPIIESESTAERIKSKLKKPADEPIIAADEMPEETASEPVQADIFND